MVLYRKQIAGQIFVHACKTATDTLSQLLTAAHQQIAKEAFGTKEIERQEEEDKEGRETKPQNWTEMEDGEIRRQREGENQLEMKARKPYKKF